MFQDVTDSLSRNVRTELPLYEASNPRRGQTLCTDVNEWKIQNQAEYLFAGSEALV